MHKNATFCYSTDITGNIKPLLVDLFGGDPGGVGGGEGGAGRSGREGVAAAAVQLASVEVGGARGQHAATPTALVAPSVVL